MSDPHLLWLLLLMVTTVISIENKPGRTLHVLAGGHLRILNEDPNDTELLTASASGSKDKKQKQDDEERKTLSQQVADGKYALIQKEIFSTPSKRPGVLSYESNSEIPKDNINNLGGLSKNDIWLAENHLLVLRGGVYPPHDDKQDNFAPIWPAIDNYKAPDRPVKLPAHPKVPPPFPVQLTEDGPLQILGTNSSRTLNGTLDENAYPLPPPEGYIPGTGPFFPPPYPYPANATPGRASFSNAHLPSPPGDYKLGAPFPPSTSLNGTLPPYFASLPPGAVFLPPPNNITEVYDEDDPSIYYPPPYSFYYPKDNNTQIRAGPLVPGIILPPPPNFFAPLEETTTAKSTPKYRSKTTTKPLKQIRPTTTPVPLTSVLDRKTTRNPMRTVPAQTPTEINNELTPRITTLRPVQKVVTVLPVKPIQITKIRPTTIAKQRKPQAGVTILKPINTKSTERPVNIKLTSKPVNIEATPQPDIYIYNNEVTGKPFKIYGPPSRTKTTTSTTQIPIKVYITTSNDIETNSVTDLPADFQHGIRNGQKSIKAYNPDANYYYYDEKRHPNGVTTPKTLQELQDVIYNIPQNYYEPAKPVVPPRQQPKYFYVTQRPYNNNQNPHYQILQQTSKPDSFKIHIARLQKQIQQYTTSKPHRPIFSPRPVYQYSYQAANYQPQHNAQPVQQYQNIPYPQEPQHNSQPVQQYQNVPYQQEPQSNSQQVQQYQNIPYQQEQHRDFRTPQQDQQDKFRPIPRYSVQIQPAVDLSPSERPMYENQQQPVYYQSNNERPVPSRYYSRPRPDYDYEDNNQRHEQQNTATPSPVNQFSFGAASNSEKTANLGVTPNPLYHGFYTKPDEGYFDDQTKKYFTVFGKKIPNATTPLPRQESTTRSPQPIYSQPQMQQQHPQRPQQPISLEGDTLVNYLHPRPTVNPDAEFIEVVSNKNRANYPRVAKYNARPAQYAQQQNRHRPRFNNNPEIVRAIPIRVPEHNGQGSFISYQLPGDDGAHFYFLTPQLARRRDQGVGYYYSQPVTQRTKRQSQNVKLNEAMPVQR